MTAASVDPEALLTLSMVTACQAVVLLLCVQSIVRSDVATKSSRTDMVSAADRAAERIRAVRLDDAILGEKGLTAEAEGVSGVRWVVDPLDGTTNYLYRHRAFVVSIGVDVAEETEVEAVYDEMFSARIGGGARLNDEPIATSGLVVLATALVGKGFGYDAERRAAQGIMVARVLPRVRVRVRGGAGRGAGVGPVLGGVRPTGRVLRARVAGVGHERGRLDRARGGRSDLGDRGGAARPGSMLASTAALHERLRAVLLEA